MPINSLKIAGTERWPDMEDDSLSIEQELTYTVDTCSFAIAGEQPTEGEEVIIEDGETRLFAGVIVKPEMIDKDLQLWQVDCDDYTSLLDRRLVVETYENMTADAIFRDIAAKYCPGFTVNGVQTGAPTVEYIIFDYIHPSECFKQLCDYVGWHWQPDYYKDLQFFSAENLASPAPLVLVPGGPFRFGKHTIDTQGLRNRVYVRGGTMLSDPQVVQWKADGVARTWVLPWGPHKVSLSVGEMPMTVGVENLHEEADFDYMMNFQEKYIRCSAQTTTPVEGITMSLTARQDIDVITMVEDLESQAAIAAVQGGDGVYEHSIVDDSLTTIQAAEAAGNADLREHANPKVSGSFETEVPGWKPGQLVDIQLPDRGVEGTYLVQKVTITRGIGTWTYAIQYGGRLLGIADFLKALVSAQQKKKLGETSILHKFQYGIDRAVVTDELESTLREPPWTVEEGQEIAIQFLTQNEFVEGFESGDFSNWSTADAGWSIVTTPVYSGIKAAKANGAPYYLRKSLPNPVIYIEMEGRFQFTEVNQYHYPFFPSGNGGSCYFIAASTNGDFRYHNGSGYLAFPNPKTYAINTWYDIKLRIDTVKGKFWVWVDGVQLTTDDGLDTKGSNGAQITNISVVTSLNTASGQTGGMVIDDIYFQTHFYSGQITTYGSLCNVCVLDSERWPGLQMATSDNGVDWGAWQDVEKLLPNEVPFPGYIKFRADRIANIKIKSWKKPLVESDTVCGFVVCG